MIEDDDQSWFWTPEWQAMERRADEDIKAGRVHHYASVEDFLASFRGSEPGEAPPLAGQGSDYERAQAPDA